MFRETNLFLFIVFVLGLLITVGISSCNCEQDEDQTVLEFVSCDDRFSILQRALERVYLNPLLTSPDVTFFAPSDQSLLDADIDIEELSDRELEALIRYGITTEYNSLDTSNPMSSYLSSMSYSEKSQEFLSIYMFTNSDNEQLVNNIPILEKEVLANGRVITRERPLTPQSINAFISFNPELSVYNSYMNSTLFASRDFFENNTLYNFTFFAPDNIAYDMSGRVPGMQVEFTLYGLYTISLQTLSSDQLKTGFIKTMHNDACIFAIVDFLPCPEPSVMGYNMTDESFFDDRGSTASIILKDIIGTNGVMHIIDNVLLPPMY